MAVFIGPLIDLVIIKPLLQQSQFIVGPAAHGGGTQSKFQQWNRNRNPINRINAIVLSNGDCLNFRANVGEGCMKREGASGSCCWPTAVCANALWLGP